MPKQSPLNLPTLDLPDNLDRQNEVIKRLSGLIIDPMTQEKLRTIFIEELELGLAKNPSRKSSLQMENTFVSRLLDKTEEGEYLALDLGSTNFRVLFLQLKKGEIVKEIVEYYDVPIEKKMGPGEQLFDFLASCIKDFITKKNIPNKNIKLGFTFSFPMIQNALDVGILITWTKSFKCSGVVGEDAVRMLNEAIQRQGGLDITVVAVLNDTTGTLVKGSFIDTRCAISMILGTGNNACYIEQVKNMEKWADKLTEKEMIVDIEWGAFGDNGVVDFFKTEWDFAVDRQSLLPKSFTYEKSISGKYLGDIVREILKTLATQKLFGTSVTEKLNTFGCFSTTSVGKIDGESMSGETSETKRIALEELGVEASDLDAKVMQYVCGLVSYRAVLLVSVLTGELLDRMKRDHTTIAIDGSVYEHHPRFKPLMPHLISSYSTYPFDIIMARDGSGKGAALIAAIADKIRNEK